MEDIYSVTTNNRFALFMDEEDDPGDTIPSTSKLPDKSERKPEAKKTDKGGKTKLKEGKERAQVIQNGRKAAADTTNKRSQRDAPAGGTERSPAKERSQRPERERAGPRENRPPRGSTSGERGEGRPQQRANRNSRGRLPSRENDAQSSSVFDESSDSNRERGPRGERPRPFRGGRGGGRLGSTGSGGGGGFRKREFERRSGSDKSSVKPMDKREGGGAHNWGSVKDEVETANDELHDTEQLPNGEVTEEKHKSEEEKEEEPEQQEDEEEEDEVISELTLDEYKAQQEKKRYRPEFNERKAGENEDQAQWKGTVRYERREDEFFPGTREEVVKLKTSGRVRTQLQGNFFFKDPARRGGGRAGTGGGRGRGGGGYDDRRRSGRNRDRAGLNVEDEKEFPSLATVSA